MLSGMNDDDIDYVRVVFRLPDDPSGWHAFGTERMWAVRVGESRVRLDNIPFHARDVACGDVVAVTADDEGTLWAGEVVEPSGACTIRVIPAEGCLRAEVRQAVLDAFEPLGVDGEGSRMGLVALNVPAGSDLEEVRATLAQGRADGLWCYDLGAVTEQWRAAGPALAEDNPSDPPPEAYGLAFPEDLAACVYNTVASGERPALVVVHDADGDWIIGDGSDEPLDPATASLLHIQHVLDNDSAVAELAALPPGKIAWRDQPADPWTIEDFAYPDEE
ncbi:hypothetical protein NCAST_20_01380 [Nocardia asteroides NBRC 15531]|uniref:DUF4265 domain-containing protein n=2 Tax=Nocardia asteroides TaxID=1824 RepID=U5E875_NOCAS|nr:hypothetical protein NCAST_20_01380 [Nocardia asteroides NBRC 15531]SFL77730.1 protein of unknown function [Nocardia asteroides]VEG31209.1 Uncharacterised protein [Nocardia asteroides]